MKEYYMNSGIYKITNNINGKFYIGSSKHIDRRWWEHTNDLIKNVHVNSKLQHSWNYHGKDAFEFIILENVSEDKLFEREDFYLKTFKPYMREIGYNLSDKASGGDWFTNHPEKENIRKNLSNINIGDKNPMFGKIHSEKSKQLQKEKSIGRYSLEWFKNKHGDIDGTIKYQERNIKLKNRKINYSYDNNLTGTKRRPMTQEEKQKISDNKKRIKLIKNDIINDIKSNLYTIVNIADKYDISMTMVKYYKRKL